MPFSVVITIGVLLVAALIGFDIWFAADHIPGNTWSEIIRHWSKVTPFVPWACGILSGHFFHPGKARPLIAPPGNIALLVWLTCLISMVGFAMLRGGHPMYPWVAFILGCIGGCLLWPV